MRASLSAGMVRHPLFKKAIKSSSGGKERYPLHAAAVHYVDFGIEI